MRKPLLLILLFIYTNLPGQDFHFSQFTNSPLNLNPALTGIYDFDRWGNDIRFIGNYRDQWRSIPSAYSSSPTPFRTNSFSTDMKIRNIQYLDKDFFGVGVSFFNDKSGDLEFKTQQANFSLSYSKRLNYHGEKYLTVGITEGYSKRSIDYTNAIFDNQWTGSHYDPSRATGETFPGKSYSYSDFSAGMVYSYIPVKKINFIGGFSIMHLNRPRQSFLAQKAGVNQPYHVVLYQTYVTHANAKIPLKNGKLIFPSLLFLRQGPASEFNSVTYFQPQPANKDRLSYQFGLGYRIVGNYQKFAASDALVTALKLIYNDFNFTFSYDVNTSSLKRATKSLGGFEISVIYYERIFNSKKFRDIKARPDCPRYDEFKNFPVW